MKIIKNAIRSIVLLAVLVTAWAQVLAEPVTEVATEYLMTVYLPLDPAQVIDDSLVVVNVRAGGWVEGPKIKGKIIQPAADWVQIMSNGSAQLNVRATILTDDDAHIYLTYNGVVRHNDESRAKQARGEVLTSDDLYFVTTPMLRTSAEKYNWLNYVVCVGKMVEQKSGDGGYVKYDLFVLRWYSRSAM